MNEKIPISPGVLNNSQIKDLFEKGYISNLNYDIPDIDASSFDLKLGKKAWKLDEGQRPSTREFAKIKARSSEISPEEDANGEFFSFQRQNIYLVELDYVLNLPGNINGRATGKSSIGRLDVITRLLTDKSSEYDVIEAGYQGNIYLLVLPQTFPLIVRPGDSLNQLRLFSGPPHASVIDHAKIEDYGRPFWHILGKQWTNLLNEYTRQKTADPNLFDLTVDLADPDLNFVYKARPEKEFSPIDLRKGKVSHDPQNYFEKVYIEKHQGECSVVLDQGHFYIMKSKERLDIPSDVAVEIIAISERIGDIRIHYAGFAHPYFGQHNDPNKSGTPLIFEVRATDMPTRLYDKSLLAKIQLFRMSAPFPNEPVKSDYDQQELKLSNVFKEWGDTA